MDTDGRDARPARRVRAARRSRRSRSSPCSSSASASRSLGVAILVLLRPAAQAGALDAGRAGARAVAARARSRSLRIPRYRALLIAGGGARPRDRERRVHLPGARGHGRPRHVAVPAAVRRQRRRVFMVLAVPMGRLADRFGRGRVLLGGYVLLLARLRRCCCCRSAAGCSSSLALGAARRLLRGDRRRPDGARQRGRARRRCAGSGLALLRTRRASPAWSRRSPSARCGRVLGHRRRDRRASRGRARRRGVARRRRARAHAGARRCASAARRVAVVARAAPRRCASAAIAAASARRPDGEGARRRQRRRARPGSPRAGEHRRYALPPASAATAASRSRRWATRRRARSSPPLRCDRVYFAAGARHLPRARRRLRGRLQREASSAPDLQGAPARSTSTACRAARASRPTAATARSRCSSPATRTPTRAVLDRDDADRPAQRAAHRRPRGVRRHPRRPPVTAVDVNFWGVTFARDSDRFYATMATGGKTYLIEGSVSRPHGEGAARERRVPVALARRHADRLQAAHRPRARGRGG